jgi:hypothetical protein
MSRGEGLGVGMGLGDGEVRGVKGAAGGGLFARPVMDGEAFQPEGEAAVVTRRVAGQGESGEFMSPRDAPLPFQADHSSEMVPQSRFVGVTGAACDADAGMDGGGGGRGGDWRGGGAGRG